MPEVKSPTLYAGRRPARSPGKTRTPSPSRQQSRDHKSCLTVRGKQRIEPDHPKKRPRLQVIHRCLKSNFEVLEAHSDSIHSQWLVSRIAFSSDPRRLNILFHSFSSNYGPL